MSRHWYSLDSASLNSVSTALLIALLSLALVADACFGAKQAALPRHALRELRHIHKACVAACGAVLYSQGTAPSEA